MIVIVTYSEFSQPPERFLQSHSVLNSISICNNTELQFLAGTWHPLFALD